MTLTINFMVDFLEDIKKIISSQLGIPLGDIEEDTFLEADLNITDLEMEDLIATIEDKYEIKIPQNKISSFKTVSDIATYLYENIDIPD